MNPIFDSTTEQKHNILKRSTIVIAFAATAVLGDVAMNLTQQQLSDAVVALTNDILKQVAVQFDTEWTQDDINAVEEDIRAVVAKEAMPF